MSIVSNRGITAVPVKPLGCYLDETACRLARSFSHVANRGLNHCFELFGPGFLVPVQGRSLASRVSTSTCAAGSLAAPHCAYTPHRYVPSAVTARAISQPGDCG